MKEKLLSTTGCAKILGVSRSRVLKLIEAGRIKAEKFGHTWIVLDYSRALNRVPGKPSLKGKGL